MNEAERWINGRSVSGYEGYSEMDARDGLMLPPALVGGRVSADLCQPHELCAKTFTELGLSDLEIRKLAAWLKIRHPETYERALRAISEDRDLDRAQFANSLPELTFTAAADPV